MEYNAIGLMSGSYLDGLDVAFVELQETGGKWTYQFLQTACMPYAAGWLERLANATTLPAQEYQLLHTDFGRYCGEAVNQFIEANQLEHKVHLVASHGHTTFHLPQRGMTAQLGDGATLAAVT